MPVTLKVVGLSQSITTLPNGAVRLGRTALTPPLFGALWQRTWCKWRGRQEPADDEVEGQRVSEAGEREHILESGEEDTTRILWSGISFEVGPGKRER
jgi:hypothetical protein